MVSVGLGAQIIPAVQRVSDTPVNYKMLLLISLYILMLHDIKPYLCLVWDLAVKCVMISR